MNLGGEGCKKFRVLSMEALWGLSGMGGGETPIGWAHMSLGTVECRVVALPSGNEVYLERSPCPLLSSGVW